MEGQSGTSHQQPKMVYTLPASQTQSQTGPVMDAEQLRQFWMNQQMREQQQHGRNPLPPQQQQQHQQGPPMMHNFHNQQHQQQHQQRWPHGPDARDRPHMMQRGQFHPHNNAMAPPPFTHQQQQRGAPPVFTQYPSAGAVASHHTQSHAAPQMPGPIAQLTAQLANRNAPVQAPAGQGVQAPQPQCAIQIPAPRGQHRQAVEHNFTEMNDGRRGNNNNNNRPLREDRNQRGGRRDNLNQHRRHHKDPHASGDGEEDEEEARAIEKRPKPAPDAELLQTFRQQYEAQEEEEVVEEHLRLQSRSKHGTVGTLRVEECLGIIDANDIAFVVTDTGTGKSTLLPKSLVERDDKAMIVNCQPRRTSTINLAQRVAVLLGEKQSGETVGFSVRGESSGELGTTRLMYVTNYTLFLYLLGHEPLNIPFTHIIVDEFHERTSEVEVMLLLLRLILQKYPKKFKVILCSASGQVEEWRSFFHGMSVGVYNEANCMYPIHEYYLEDTCKMLGLYCNPPAASKRNVVESIQLQNVLLNIKHVLEFLAREAAPQHSILVFLPGRTNVEQMSEWIRANLSEQLDPITWYRDVDLSVIQSAIQREAITKKKVYLATDIAEVSVTLPDVVFVLDSGTCKRPLISERDPHSTAFPPLQLLWESNMNAQQRRGRVGRVQQGFYFSMLARPHMKDLATGDPRITNDVITELVLHSLQLTSAPFALMDLCHYKPRSASVHYSLVTLRDGGYILPDDDPRAATECVTRAVPHEETRAREEWETMIERQSAQSMVLAAEKRVRREMEHMERDELRDMRQELVTIEAKNAAAAAAAAAASASDNNAGDLVHVDKTEEPEDALRHRVSRSPSPGAVDPSSLKFVVTVKGMLASHLPVDVESASMVYYGLLYGVPNLAIIAAAVESIKSPFNVPYNLTDRMERMKVRNAVSDVMRTYRGELKSDIISCVGAVLDYMDMQRNGLSDEGQEEWCAARFLSRTRLVDIVNLVVQMRSQTADVVPFVDVTDVDLLLAQFQKQAHLLGFIVVATHTKWGFYVSHNDEHAQKRGYNATGIFFRMRCARDMFVPSVCPWTRHSVCVPLSLQIAYNKLRATTSAEVAPPVFNLALLAFSYRIWFEKLQQQQTDNNNNNNDNNNRDPGYLFQVCYMNVFQSFVCDSMTAQQILQMRRIQCARLHTLQIVAEGRVRHDDAAAITTSLRAMQTDFGLPEVAYEQPHLISVVLESAMTSLLKRLETSRGAAHGEPVCNVVENCLPSGNASMSLLVHSSNGIVASAAVGEQSAQAAAKAAAEAERIIAAGVHDEDDDDSDDSSDDGGHVPQFTFDE